MKGSGWDSCQKGRQSYKSHDSLIRLSMRCHNSILYFVCVCINVVLYYRQIFIRASRRSCDSGHICLIQVNIFIGPQTMFFVFRFVRSFRSNQERLLMNNFKLQTSKSLARVVFTTGHYTAVVASISYLSIPDSSTPAAHSPYYTIATRQQSTSLYKFSSTWERKRGHQMNAAQLSKNW